VRSSADSGVSTIYVRPTARTPDGGVVYSDTERKPDTNSWQAFQNVTDVVPPATDRVEVIIGLYGIGCVLIDDVSFAKE
jgi:hypothetical protein